MSLSAKLRRAPQRAVTGAFILNSGITKLSADDDTAKQLHGMATGTYPFLGKVQPRIFTKGLAAGEIALGSALLLPIVPTAVAGAALVGFSGALLNMYWHTPGMHQEGNPRPTPQGTAIAKDSWMFGIGLSLVTDALLEPAHDKKLELEATVSEKRAAKGRRAKRKAQKIAAKRTNVELGKQARELQDETAKRARKAAARAQKQAGKAAAKTQKQAAKATERAAKRLAEVRAEYGPIAAEKAKQVRDTAREWAEEYGPVAAEKAQKATQQARETARSWAGEYGPVAAEKAKDAAQQARDWAGEYGPVAAEKAKDAAQQARDWAEEYGPIAAEKAKDAADKAKDAAEAAREAGARAKERVAS